MPLTLPLTAVSLLTPSTRWRNSTNQWQAILPRPSTSTYAYASAARLFAACKVYNLYAGPLIGMMQADGMVLDCGKCMLMVTSHCGFTTTFTILERQRHETSRPSPLAKSQPKPPRDVTTKQPRKHARSGDFTRQTNSHSTSKLHMLQLFLSSNGLHEHLYATGHAVPHHPRSSRRTRRPRRPHLSHRPRRRVCPLSTLMYLDEGQ